MSNKAFVSKKGDTNSYYSHLAINKSRLKEFYTKNDYYSNLRNFYLSGDTEFQIELFNPTSKTLGAKISINGKSISSSYLLLYPGQRVWLERDFDSKNKFKFTIYEIDKNDPIAVEATKNNGEIKIEFYEERQLIQILPYNYYTDITWSTTNSTGGMSNNILGFQQTTTNCCNTTCDSRLTYIDDAVMNSCLPEQTMETGIINRSGNKSKQEFNNVDGIEFNYLPSKVEIMYMLPLSAKQLTAEDMKIRKYCPNCGRKLKANYNFCPVCGTKVE